MTKSSSSRWGACRLAGLCAALAAAAALLGASPAMATVTGTQLTSVTTYDGITSTSQDPLFTGYDTDSGSPLQMTVSGTATTNDNNAADAVDIKCFYDDYGHDWDTLATGVPVQPDGTFSYTGNLGSSITCHLAAVPAGYSGPNDFNQFKARAYGVGYQSSSTIHTGGPNDGTRYDYYIDQHQLKGYIEWDSVGSCGADWSNVFSGDNFQDYDSYTPMDCALASYTNGGGDGYGRSEVQVDGNNAYNSAGAYYNGDYNDANFPGVTVTRSTDPLTGNLTIDESESLVHCGAAAFPANSTCDPSNPNTFEDTGVRFSRHIVQNHDGLQATVTDTYQSTDGNQHAIDVEYDQYAYEDDIAGFKVPGSDRYKTYATGDQVNLPASTTGTIYVEDLTYPQGDNPDYSLPGSYTYTTQPDRMFFNSDSGSNTGEFVLDYKRTVPAGGSLSITHVVTQGLTPTDVAAMSDSQPPAVAITSPANGSTSQSSDVVVTGTASDDNGTPTLTVNGIPTPVQSDGTWSQHLTLSKGGNTITAIAKDIAGNQSQASEVVNYAPANAQCTVPNVVGKTTAQAIAALTAAGCRLGQQTAATSSKVAAGKVISQGIPAGVNGQIGLPVPVTVSIGRFAGAKLVSKTIHLNGRSLVVTVRCGSAAVETGTVKIRTTSGRNRTLGTSAFSCPRNKKRTVHFTISGTSAKVLKQNGRTKTLVFIVARNSTGDTRSYTGHMTIVG